MDTSAAECSEPLSHLIDVPLYVTSTLLMIDVPPHDRCPPFYITSTLLMMDVPLYVTSTLLMMDVPPLRHLHPFS